MWHFRRALVAGVPLWLLLLAAIPREAGAGWSCLGDAATCAALGDLYTAAGGAGWAARTPGWQDAAAGTPAAACSLRGVSCDANGQLTALRLPSNSLYGTLPASLGALSALRFLDASGNFGLYGTLPPLQNSSLEELNLSDTTLTDTLPAWLGALPALTALHLSHTFVRGAVPASLGAVPWRTLELGTNVLDSAGFPPALCPFACNWTNAFNCPVQHSCALGPQCAPQCMFQRCPLQSLTVADFAGLRTTCSGETLGSVCTVCLPNILTILSRAGVADDTSGQLTGCVRAYSGIYVEAGASVTGLQKLESPGCGAVLSFQPVNATECPITFSAAQAAPLVGPCSVPNDVCYTCGSAILSAFQQAGLFPGFIGDPSLDLSRSQFRATNKCVQRHFGTMLAAGVTSGTLVALIGCPVPKAEYIIAAALRLEGVRASDVSSSAFESVLGPIIGVDNVDVDISAIADASSRRMLLDIACVVRFYVYLDTQAEMAAADAALSRVTADGALLVALRGAGINATAISRVYEAAAEEPNTGTIVGAVVGSVCGAALLAAGCVLALRRRAAAGTDGGDKGQQRADSWSGRLRPLAPSGHSSEDTQQVANPLLQGWTAVLSTANEVELDECIGTGGYAAVYTARWRGTVVAVKVFNKHTPHSALRVGWSTNLPGEPSGAEMPSMTRSDGTTARNDDATFVREVAVLSQLRHPNILAVYAIVQRPAPMLVMELAAAGSLRALLRRSTLDSLPWLRRIHILLGVAAGVEFLHAQTPPIIHMDLKSDNIVMSVDALTPKVCDFGLSSMKGAWPHAGDDVHGTPRYMAPEVARGQEIISWEAVDAYGFGWIAHDVAHENTDAGAAQRLAEAGVDARSSLTQTVSAATVAAWAAIRVMMERERAGYESTVDARVPPPLAALLTACLAVEPQQRPSLPQIRAHLVELRTMAADWPSAQEAALAGAGGTVHMSDAEQSVSAAPPSLKGGDVTL